MSQQSGSSGRGYDVISCDINSRGNYWESRDYTPSTGGNQVSDNTYYYSNRDGSYFYSNSNGSTYYNDGRGWANYTSANGNGWSSYTPPGGSK